MQQTNRSFLASIPPVTLHLIIINVLMWLATVAFERAGIIDLVGLLGMRFWKAEDFHIYQFVTYMFMHGGFMHLFCNMFSLWMFGGLLERLLGRNRYLIYYFVCGLGAAVAQQLVWQISLQGMEHMYNYVVTVGASGATFGILVAFGMLFPNMPMYVIPFPFPIKAKWFVIGYGLFTLYCGLTGDMSGIAHFAHLGGLITGFFLILFWKRKGILNNRYGFYQRY